MGEYMAQASLQDPIAFSANTDLDTMYLREAKRQPDRPQFQQAMQEEVFANDTRAGVAQPYPQASKFSPPSGP